ncbi:hypothetical protein HU200_001909 [Digitaria exilis]|uniref:Uncharacterized protein n=1 Tax=Digitaria exilis TaxID=1010633 RepID=A0A835G0P3_9POAL|nr:hypothetical protein HU200_001909 [Digitaria exilis]
MVGAETLAPAATDLSLACWWMRVRKRVPKDTMKMFDGHLRRLGHMVDLVGAQQSHLQSADTLNSATTTIY